MRVFPAGSRGAQLRRIAAAIFVLVAGLAPSPRAETATAAGEASFDGERALAGVAAIVAAGPRYYGAESREGAIESLLRALGEHTDQVARQRFRARESGTGVEYELSNLIGRRNPTVVPRILLGSHYDTRLWAEEDADPARREQPIPGVNDGTSGVALLLELLRVAEARPALGALGLDVVLFDGEEFGRPWNRDYCKGSVHFVRRLRDTYPKSPPIAVIVVDMVGDRDLRIRRERSSMAPLSRWLTDEIWRHGRRVGGGAFAELPTGTILDDQFAFQQAGIPATLVIDLEYPHWHTHQDTLDKLSAASLEAVGRALESALPAIAAKHSKAGERSAGP